MTDKLSYQQRRAIRLDDPRMEGLRNPRARRLLSAGLMGTLVLELALILSVPVIPLVVFIGGMVVLMFAMVMLLGALKGSTWGVEELAPEVLDERQAQLRGEIFARSYAVLGVVAVLACVVLALMQQDWWEAPAYAPVIVAAFMVQLVVTIPTFVTALRVRV